MQHCRIRALVMATSIWCVAEAAAFAGGSVDGHAAGQTFRDCTDYCPEMVVIPPGKFTIGTPASEVGRGSDENPQQVVTIGYALAVGKYPVTRREFAAFVKDTGQTLGACEHWDGKSFQVEKDINWRNTFHQLTGIPSSASTGTMPKPMFYGCRAEPASTIGY